MAAPRTLEGLWASAPPAAARFDPAVLAGLPDGARRFLGHVLAPGALLPNAVRLAMEGEIRLGDWRPFKADQVIVRGRGMIWAARVGGGLPIRGWDRLVDGRGAMRWSLLGLVPVLRAEGPDVTRSARGRLRAESVWLPSLLADPAVGWTETAPGQLRARIPVDGEAGDVDLGVDEAGRLREVRLARWGNPGGGPFREEPFGGAMEEEVTVAGLSLPARVRVGWWFGTDRFEAEGEFFRARITRVEFR